VKAIAALAANGAIGKGNSLPWGFKEYPDDLAQFKKITANGKLVFGATTFRGLSGNSILSMIKDRTIFVLTKNPSWMAQESSIKKLAWGKQIFTIKDMDRIPQDAWICGGAKVYESLLPACDELILTFIYKPYDGDTFFPPFEEDFHLIEKAVNLNQGFEFRHYTNKYNSLKNEVKKLYQ
jgi:dihydrofolate reductase